VFVMNFLLFFLFFLFVGGSRFAVELINLVAPFHLVSLVCHNLLANFKAVEVLEGFA